MRDLIDIRDPDLIRLVDIAGRFRMTLPEYIRPVRVLPETGYGEAEFNALYMAQGFVEMHRADPGRQMDSRRPLRVPGLLGVTAETIGVEGGNLLLNLDGSVVAGIYKKTSYVCDGFRGQGLGALMVLISDIHQDRFLDPYAYSESGFRARISAHTLQTEIALRAGLYGLNRELLSDFGVRGGRIVRKSAWGVGDQNAYADRKTCEKGAEGAVAELSP